MSPLDWNEKDWIASALPKEDDFVVEGYWLPRPWTSSESCPVRPADAESDDAKAGVENLPDPIEAESTVGLAQFLGKDSNRSRQRRGRPLEVVVSMEPEEVPAGGLQLGFEGRIANVPGRRSPTLCRADSVNTRPSCLIAVEMERVSVLNPVTGQEIANWRF
ncbi:hypothetical protein G7076_03150 [Sphingomonas sp. HDW15A]|uniref:hypothetical protein n=1 Tax=Sphingomonas sp. HDW15A TaxID=2714942 RepID=UPI00140A9272|nr:hypothetical protein [Sphingomonas sp. HDW15A]QIK95607.1 hypothetical protein G7076_03150 [Sphingomonas sp. HDW15A]